jgi:hypothetical protein
MSGEANSPFVLGNPVTQLAAAAAGIKLTGDPASGGLLQYVIWNTNAANVAVAWNTVAATAQTNAAVPSAGNASASGVTILGANQVKTFTAPPGQFWSSSSALVFIQPGNGI